MELIDNIQKTFAEDLRSELTTGSHMSIAASVRTSRARNLPNKKKLS